MIFYIDHSDSSKKFAMDKLSKTTQDCKKPQGSQNP